MAASPESCVKIQKHEQTLGQLMILGHTERNNEIKATGSLNFPNAFEAEQSYIYKELREISLFVTVTYTSRVGCVIFFCFVEQNGDDTAQFSLDVNVK